MRENGGRGVANKLESYLINPLAREIFLTDYRDGDTIRVIDLIEVESAPSKEQGAKDQDDAKVYRAKLEVVSR